MIHSGGQDVVLFMEYSNDIARSVLIADHDSVFREALAGIMQQRGFRVQCAATLDEARRLIQSLQNGFLVTDLRFPDGSGLDLLEDVQKQASAGARNVQRAIVVTNYGTVACAVAAARLGAADFLPKPSDAETIEAALRGGGAQGTDRVFARPDEIEFRYLLTIFEEHDRNMSETARAIGMHRRTLQRILRRRGIAPTAKNELEQPDERRRNRRLSRLWSHLLREDTVPDLVALGGDEEQELVQHAAE